MQRPAPRPALAPLPAPAGLFRDNRFDHRRRLRRTPTKHHRERQNVNVRINGANVINAVKRRIAGHRRDVDRWILHPDVRVGEIERESLPHLPTCADRGPDPVIVRYEWYAHPVVDRGNLVSSTGAHRQPVAPLILAAQRKEPAVLILERYRYGRAIDGSGRSRSRAECWTFRSGSNLSIRPCQAESAAALHAAEGRGTRCRED